MEMSIPSTRIFLYHASLSPHQRLPVIYRSDGAASSRGRRPDRGTCTPCPKGANYAGASHALQEEVTAVVPGRVMPNYQRVS